jgi:hypothetical protein
VALIEFVIQFTMYRMNNMKVAVSKFWFQTHLLMCKKKKKKNRKYSVCTCLQMKKNGMCGACSMYGVVMRCLVLGWGSLYDRDYLDDQGIDGNNITMDLQEVECGESLD